MQRLRARFETLAHRGRIRLAQRHRGRVDVSSLCKRAITAVLTIIGRERKRAATEGGPLLRRLASRSGVRKARDSVGARYVRQQVASLFDGLSAPAAQAPHFRRNQNSCSSVDALYHCSSSARRQSSPVVKCSSEYVVLVVDDVVVEIVCSLEATARPTGFNRKLHFARDDFRHDVRF
jgi:hypothetical protein